MVSTLTLAACPVRSSTSVMAFRVDRTVQAIEQECPFPGRVAHIDGVEPMDQQGALGGIFEALELNGRASGVDAIYHRQAHKRANALGQQRDWLHGAWLGGRDGNDQIKC